MEAITGRYAYVPNPCTTKPCLPGMAYAINAKGTDYFLTVNGRSFSENRPWNRNPPPLRGDEVDVTGKVSKQKDIRGDEFRTIEVASLVPKR